MKRVFCLLLSLILVISLFSIPAFAATEDEFIDLLTWDDYSCSGVYYSSPDFPYGLRQYTVKFGSFEESVFTSSIYFSVRSEVQPTSVRFHAQGISHYYLTYISSDADVHYYEYHFSDPISFLALFELTISFPSITTFDVSIESFYCLSDSVYTPFDSVHAKITGMLYEPEDQSYYRQTFVNETASLPYESSLNSSDMPSIPANVQLYDFFTFDFEVPYAESFQMTFISTGVFTNYYDSEHLSIFGCTLNASSGAVNIPYTVASSMMDSTWYGDPVWRHTIFVDLSGLDLSDSSLTCSVLVEGIYQNENNDNWFIRIENAGYYQVFHNQTLYHRFLEFIRNQRIQITDWLQSIGGGITNLTNKLEQWFGGIADSGFSPIDQEEMDQIQTESDDTNTGIGDVIEDIEGATPDLPDFDDTGLGEFAGDVEGDTSPVLPIFIVIYENPMILKMMLYCFMFALGGFLLFGER